MSSLFSKNKEAYFWKWFVRNKARIESFMDSDFSDYTIYKRLTKQLKSYNSILFPELTKTQDGIYVLIITPDGDEKGIEPVQKLFESRPAIENWIVKKFRQPNDEIDLNFDGIEYPSSDIEIIPIFADQDRVDLEIFVRNLNQDEGKYKALAFLYLDHILGEFNTITKIRYVDFFHLDKDQSVKGSIGLLELRKLIEEKLY